MAIKDLVSKDDFIYFFSIIGSFASLSLLKQISFETCLQEYFNFRYSHENFLYLFSGLILLLAFLKRVAVLIKKQPQYTHPMWENDIGLILGTIFVCSLRYSLQHNPSICDQKKFYQLITWFLVARIFSFFGHFLNRFGNIKSWNTFGDSFTVFTLFLALGMAYGIDSYIFI